MVKQDLRKTAKGNLAKKKTVKDGNTINQVRVITWKI
jgi:hypothetical protein